MELCLIYTTFESLDQAEDFVSKLIEKDLVGCANLFPEMHSLYKWKGSLCKQKEVGCILKIAPKNLDQVHNWIQNHHPYDTPAIIDVTANCNAAFFDFLNHNG